MPRDPADLIVGRHPVAEALRAGVALRRLSLAEGMRPSPVLEFGNTRIRPTPEGRRDPVMSVWQEGDRVFHWHEDTFDLPEGATLLIESDGAGGESSLRIVPWPWPSAIVALVAFDRFTKKVSSGS